MEDHNHFDAIEEQHNFFDDGNNGISLSAVNDMDSKSNYDDLETFMSKSSEMDSTDDYNQNSIVLNESLLEQKVNTFEHNMAKVFFLSSMAVQITW